MSADIIKQLKSLRSVGPGAEWKKTTRAFLVAEARNNFGREAAGETWASELAKIIFPWKVLQLVGKPVLAVLAIFGLVLGSGLSVSASERALPGDTLYPLKLATERVQVALTFDAGEQAKIHVELAGKRVNEVKKIKETTDSPQNKIQKIGVAMDNFQEEIAAAGNKLDNLNKEVTPEATVELAKIVDSKANEYKEALNETKSELPVDGEAAQKINQGLNVVDEAGDQALAVIVEKHVQGEVVQPEEEVLNRVEKKIETTEVQVTAIENQINSLSLPSAEPAAVQVQETTLSAKAALNDAREALSQKEVTIALDKAFESKRLAREAQEIATEASLVTMSENTEPTACETCGANDVNSNVNAGTGITSSDLTNTNVNAINTVNTNTANTNTNTNTVKVYVPPVKVVTPPPPAEPVVDESTLKVGIDLKQEPAQE